MPTLVDEDAARELELYADNTASLYNQKLAIIQNITRKLKNGTYDHSKAPKLWQYWIDAAAREFVEQYGLRRCGRRHRLLPR